MNFLDFERKIKKENLGKVCIIRLGVFYYSLEKDALVLEKHCNLDKICFSPNICKVAFPVMSIEKYIDILTERKVSFCVYDYLIGNSKNFLDEKTFVYKDKEYGKIFETDFGSIDYSKYEMDCFNCKFYEKEIVCNVSRLTDAINKYVEEIEKFNEYKLSKKNESKQYTFFDYGDDNGKG